MKKRPLLYSFLALSLIASVCLAVFIGYMYSTLPDLITIDDYKPRLVTEVHSRDGEKVGEFYKDQVRLLVPYDDIPPMVVKSFLAAEDGSFFEHSGFNYFGIARALWINLISGKKKQGASTISQQTARTIFLSLERTWKRKLKEALMTYKMEANLSKEEILYLYLNQIFLGHGAYGVRAAAETFYRKNLDELNLAEMSLIAGLLPAPSRYNPIRNPSLAKLRQAYVLKRMVTEGFITDEESKEALQQTITIHTKKKYKKIGPHYVELVRQLLFKEFGEKTVLEEGLKVTLGMDSIAQITAQESMKNRLKEIDKRRGYRGAKSTIDINSNEQEELKTYLTKLRKKVIRKNISKIQLLADGTSQEVGASKAGKFDPLDIKSPLPNYLKVGEVTEGVVISVNDSRKWAKVLIAEGQGIIPIEDMKWARKFNPKIYSGDYLHIKRPSSALAEGDIIDVKILSGTFAKFPDYAHLSLEQDPDIEGAALSIDQETQDITAMVGGYDYFASTANHKNSKFNRATQAKRQAGSSFKPFVYAAGLAKGLTPATPIMGAPIVYGGKTLTENDNVENQTGSSNSKLWKPKNYSGKFTGDVLLRNALKKSLNTPTIRVLERAGVAFSASYARRLGIFSDLNMDMSLALGTSGTTVYEMTKAYAVFANQGRRVKPILIRKVEDAKGNLLLENVSLDEKFADKLQAIDEEFEEKRSEYSAKLAKYQTKLSNLQIPEEGETSTAPPKAPVNAFFFEEPDQLISPQVSYLVTHMLKAVISEPGGTGRKAAKLNYPAAGKTGTSNQYFDAWFIGYTPIATTAVWVGYDKEKSLGKGESGGKAALPIWVDIMEAIHKDFPEKDFSKPEGIVYSSIDNKTGRLLEGEKSMRVPFIEGTQPGSQPLSDEEEMAEEQSFLKDNF